MESTCKYMPLAIEMSGMRCLVVGGGKVACRKVQALLAYKAQVTVVSPGICEALQKEVTCGSITWLSQCHDEKIQFGYVLIIAATSDALLNSEIAQIAERNGQLCCNTSSRKSTRVLFPAALKEDNLCISVHSDGQDCKESIGMRDRISRWLSGNG